MAFCPVMRNNYCRDSIGSGHENQGGLIHQDKNRRYQDFDPRAPTSYIKKAENEKKEWEQSHSGNNTKSGIIAPIPASA